MPNRNYYPLPSVSGGGGPFGIDNMWDSANDARADQQQRYTGNPSGGLTLPWTAIVSGGVPPYTYTWSPSDMINISSTTTADVVFSATGSGGGPNRKTQTFNLNVSDSTSPTPLTDEKWISIGFFFDVSIP
mgnify:FL=1